MTKRGKFVVVDGIDGVGKGVFLNTFTEEAKKDGRKIFDVHQFWNEHDYHPPLGLIVGNYDVILTSEPTFIGIGRYIREELIAKNNRNYSPETVAAAYALDRHILYEQLLLPLLEAGVDVYQSRSFASSIVYQRQSALDAGREFSVSEILSLQGNSYCYQNPMSFLIVPTIKDVQEAVRRAELREKDDDCQFENLAFQLKIKNHYESDEFKEIFRQKGVPVVYLDAGKTLDFSQQQARDFFRENLK